MPSIGTQWDSWTNNEAFMRTTKMLLCCATGWNPSAHP